MRVFIHTIYENKQQTISLDIKQRLCTKYVLEYAKDSNNKNTQNKLTKEIRNLVDLKKNSLLENVTEKDSLFLSTTNELFVVTDLRVFLNGYAFPALYNDNIEEFVFSTEIQTNHEE